MKRIVCFGDSLTFGYDPKTAMRFQENDRYPCILNKLLGSEYQVIEEGQCGRTIAVDDFSEGEKNGIKYIIPCIESHKPLDLLIIMLGSNDIKDKFNYSTSDIASELELMLEKIQAYNMFHLDNKMKVLVIAPPIVSEGVKKSWFSDSYTFESCNKKTKELYNYYKMACNKYNCYAMDSNLYIETSKYDGIHIDEENQNKLGVAIYNKILELGI